MIQFIIMEQLIRAARESGEVNDQQLDAAVAKLILWTLGILGCILLVEVLTDPQFCFRRQFLELWVTIVNLC